MKAISLWQPWASAIPAGLKTIETRSWSTGYRGMLAIHAAKRFSPAEQSFWNAQIADNITRGAFARLGILSHHHLPRGYIVATCEIYGCISTNEDPYRLADRGHQCGPTELDWGNYGADRFAWLLRNIKPLDKPVHCVGRQGFFDWTP